MLSTALGNNRGGVNLDSCLSWGPFSVKLAYFPCLCVCSLRLLQLSPTVHVELTGNLKMLAPGDLGILQSDYPLTHS